MGIIRIGTRRSPLARHQAGLVAAQIEHACGGALKCRIITFVTRGDTLANQSLVDAGGKGLFTREIDRAVDSGEVDIGVHSLKDVPATLPDGQQILACPARADSRDGLLSLAGKINRIQDLPPGSRLGTASLRRRAQALALRPDLKIVIFRGNVQTRIKKLQNGDADATILAMAGLERLGLKTQAIALSPEDMLPAVGQGILAVTAHQNHITSHLRDVLTCIDHDETRAMAIAERAFLTELDGSCRNALAARLVREPDGWVLHGEVLHPDGKNRWRNQIRADSGTSLDGFVNLGRGLAERIRGDAGPDFPVWKNQ